MDELQIIQLLRRWSRQTSTGLREDFSAAVLERLGPRETRREVFPLLLASSALALCLSGIVSAHRQHLDAAVPPPVLSLFAAQPDQAPFSSP